MHDGSLKSMEGAKSNFFFLDIARIPHLVAIETIKETDNWVMNL